MLPISYATLLLRSIQSRSDLYPTSATLIRARTGGRRSRCLVSDVPDVVHSIGTLINPVEKCLVSILGVHLYFNHVAR